MLFSNHTSQKEGLFMEGIEVSYANVCLNALVGAFRRVLDTTVGELVSFTEYGKKDTKGFDAIFESIIQKRLSEYDGSVILVTEETDHKTHRRWPVDPEPEQQPKMFFSDPVDRSKFFEKLILEIAQLEKDKDKRVVDILSEGRSLIKIWEEKVAEKPAIITGATSAITYVKEGKTVFSAILNIITRELIVACGMGIARMTLPHDLGTFPASGALEHIIKKGKRITFPSSMDKNGSDLDFNRFVTYLGKPQYREFFRESNIFAEDSAQFIHHNEPGGPSRVLYLSDMQEGCGPVGFILSNGEKIGEWIHWLPFVKFASNSLGNPALRLYEISLKKSAIKDHILVSPPRPYSIFNCDRRECYIDVSRMKNIAMPSRFRTILVVAPADNEKIHHIMARHEYRDVSSCL